MNDSGLHLPESKIVAIILDDIDYLYHLKDRTATPIESGNKKCSVQEERTSALNVCPSCDGTKIGCDSFTGEIYCLLCGLVL